MQPERMNSEEPTLACVVTSLNNEPHLVDAVRSLVEQDTAVEIVVVNSGGGDPGPDLKEAGLAVKVLNFPNRLYPGAACNAGIRATRAPFVAFLCADCLAEPGWVKGRVLRHRGGAAMVSSAIANAYPASIAAWAAQILLFATRAPGIPPERAVLHGRSYRRELFDLAGLFREDLRTGEDTDMAERLTGFEDCAWAPDVRSAHRHPRTVCRLLANQFMRGVRMHRSLRAREGSARRWSVAANAMARVASGRRLALATATPGERKAMRLAGVLLYPAAAMYALGALCEGVVRPDPPGYASSEDRPPTGRSETPSAATTPSEPRIIALLSVHNGMKYLPDYLENVGPHVDGVVVLDDGSTDGSGDYARNHPAVLEVLRNEEGTHARGGEPETQRKVREAALAFQPDWLVAVDVDERVERRFRHRFLAEIQRAEACGFRAYTLLFRELWDRPDQYRVDGIWGRKRPARIFKARSGSVFDTRKLHTHWAPLDARLEDGQFAPANLILYHLTMIKEEDRIRRRDKFNQMDPNREWQSIGYDYLTDPTGLQLEGLPPGREYTPGNRGIGSALKIEYRLDPPH